MVRSNRFVPDWPAVVTSALLSITVSVIHVLDQGGITKWAGPPWWLGWGYRAIEAGGVLSALALLVPRLGLARPGLAGLGRSACWSVPGRSSPTSPRAPWACPAIQATSATGATGWARSHWSSRLP